MSQIRYACDFVGCKNDDAKMRCSVCKLARYCSVECQKEAWKDHKNICDEAFQVAKPRVLIQKILHMYENDILNVINDKNERKGGVFTIGFSEEAHDIAWWDFHIMEKLEFASPEKIQEMKEAFSNGYSIYGIAQDNKFVDAIYFRKEKK